MSEQVSRWPPGFFDRVDPDDDSEFYLSPVRRYLEEAGGFVDVRAALRTPPGRWGDPLYAVWARRRSAEQDDAADTFVP